jgi:PAS domain S-box-containing protein
MDRIFLRNFLLLATIIALCVGSLSFALISGERTLSRTDELVVHSYDVITKSEQLSTLVESMLAAQRGYFIASNEEFHKEYQAKKIELSDLIAHLSELTADNARQGSRIDELRHHISVFTDRLEEKSRLVALRKPGSTPTPILEDIAAINDARININRINDSILKDEYEILRNRITLMEKRKHQYFNSLLVGGITAAILLLIINAFLFQALTRRSRAEQSLEESQQRFGLAIEGMNDGIYDWDIKNGDVFYSKQFFSMLGYHNRDSFIGSIDDSKMLIHPDDVLQAIDHREQYLNRQITEYSSVFRMRHASGVWLWIHARGKAIFDAAGNPLRMVGAHTDITYMREYQERLKHEKEVAEQANRAKSDFLAHMSHEIRTPLTAISGIAEILDRSKASFTAKHQVLVQTLGTSTSSLKDLISDILDFSKIESGELELDDKSFELDDLFKQVSAIMSVKAQEKGLVFTFDYASIKDVRFFGDIARMRQILINLISNALKFSDQGSVLVHAYRAEQNGVSILQVDVKDTGIGIPTDKFGIIFERFKQADSSVSRKYGGTGLGLPISKNLALMMGGDILLESTVGKGSTFSLILPFRIATDEEYGTEPQDIIISNKLNDQIKSSMTGDNKILLVEDYEGNIVVIGYILDDLGISYDIARTGLQALEQWKNHYYNLILMDVQMPEMDGITACTRIREMEQEKNLLRTPIVGMTAHALVADKDKCIDAGMDAYLPKPIVESDLRKEIFRFIKKKPFSQTA